MSTWLAVAIPIICCTVNDFFLCDFATIAAYEEAESEVAMFMLVWLQYSCHDTAHLHVLVLFRVAEHRLSMQAPHK